jgi:hypothetical protein
MEIKVRKGRVIRKRREGDFMGDKVMRKRRMASIATD